MNKRWLEQAVWHLLSNALAACGKGGRVTVTLLAQRAHVLIKVADNGRGVPEHWRPEESPSLGFRVVRGLVFQLRGTLSWTSGPGRGLAVTVTFPMPTEKNGDGR